MSAITPEKIPDTKFILASRRFRAMLWPVLAMILTQTGLGDLLGPLEIGLEALLTLAGVGEWFWHHFRPDGKEVTLKPKIAQALLLVLLCLNPYVVGCVGVPYDGESAYVLSVVSVEATRSARAGSPLTDIDCAPIERFANAMRDKNGSDKAYRWMWREAQGTKAQQLAGKADIVSAACRRIQSLGSSGQVTITARATILEFWSAVGVIRTSDVPSNRPVIVSIRRVEES